MTSMIRTLGTAAAVVALVVVVSWTSAGEPTAAHPKVVRIGVAESLCRDLDPTVLMVLIPPFRTLARSCTGLDCDVVYGGDAMQLANRLGRGQLELGIFQGIELAWARQKHPDLLPLMTVLNGKPYLRAFLVVPACSKATGLPDLKSRSLAIARYSLDDCYQFLGKLCREQGLSPQQLLSQLVQPPDAEDALDGVVDGAIGAAIVEEISLDCYRRRKPGRFERLRVVQRSEPFPATVIAYRTDALSRETLRAFREGMRHAHSVPSSRHLLTWWRVTGFEEVPASYQRELDAIVKAYPTPVEGTQALTLHSLLNQADRLLGGQWSSFLRAP